MRLSETEARTRLAAHDHGVLGTVHDDRGADLVPVVYVVDADGFVGIPVDLVKPKASTRLQRERNLEADPRATLLAEHWDPGDWSALWWVRATLRREHDDHRAATLLAALGEKYEPYRATERAVVRVLVFRITGLTGWSGRPD